MSKDDSDDPNKAVSLFPEGFTVPPALRMNSMYGKHATAYEHSGCERTASPESGPGGCPQVRQRRDGQESDADGSGQYGSVMHALYGHP